MRDGFVRRPDVFLRGLLCSETKSGEKNTCSLVSRGYNAALPGWKVNGLLF